MRSRHRLSIAELSPWLIPESTPGEPAAPVDWTSLFGNDRSVEIEVGFGKGLFLLSSATARPEFNFLGIEIVRKYALYVATRLAIRKLPNAKVACADAKPLLRDRVPQQSVRAVHVFFPDPWWKKRHQKRRLFTPEFVASVARVLQIGGLFNVVTDVDEYFKVMAGIVSEFSVFDPVPPPPANEPLHDLDYLTNFERKFRKEGRPIYRAAFVKKSP